MAEYMSACNCVISKAGPGTIAEAMICGVPIILNGISQNAGPTPLLSHFAFYLRRMHSLPGRGQHPICYRQPSWSVQ